MKNRALLFICFGLSLLLTGCGATSSGALKVGTDAYIVNVSSSSNPSEAKKIAYSDAIKKCADSGKEMTVVQEKQVKDINLYVVDLSFKCVGKDSVEVQK